ncbi:hypothetical protein [Aurantiacibacter xanthus]|nr:hypothetical protein [Aurantiacibacter xanthus]
MRASYLSALAWLAHHDDCGWAYRDDTVLSAPAQLVVHLWDKAPRLLAYDLRALRMKEGLGHA